MFSKSISRAVLVMVAVAAMLLLPSCSASGNRFYSSSDPTSIVARPSASSSSSISIADPVIEEPEPELEIVQSLRPSFSHGPKGAQFQKYIVLHDTEDDSDALSIIDWWESNGRLIASQFVIDKDGTIVQCVPMDEIAHHSGYGDTGHNQLYGIVEDGRDDMRGTSPIGSWASDYGMNAWSIGIELVHSGDAPYPEAQLDALDDLIAYIDEYYGFESTIIDHKAWRSGNSDTSTEFQKHLSRYQTLRSHD